MVSTHLKNISQIGSFPQIGVKITNIWNHHLVFLFIFNFCLEVPAVADKNPSTWVTPLARKAAIGSGPTKIVIYFPQNVFQGPATKTPKNKIFGWWSDETGKWVTSLHRSTGSLVQDSWIACRPVPPTTIIAGLGQPGGIRVLRFRSLKWKVVIWWLLGGWGCYDEKKRVLSRES